MHSSRGHVSDETEGALTFRSFLIIEIVLHKIDKYLWSWNLHETIFPWDFGPEIWRPYLLVTRGNKNVESRICTFKRQEKSSPLCAPKYSWWRRYSAMHQRSFDRVACDQLLTVPTLDAKVEDYLSAQEIHRIDDFTQVGLHFDINIMRCKLWPLDW